MFEVVLSKSKLVKIVFLCQLQILTTSKIIFQTSIQLHLLHVYKEHDHIMLLFQSAVNPILMFNAESHLLQFHLTFSTLAGSFYSSFIFAISRCQANSITKYNSMSLILSEYLYHTFIFLFKNNFETRPLPLYLKQ